MDICVLYGSKPWITVRDAYIWETSVKRIGEESDHKTDKYSSRYREEAKGDRKLEHDMIVGKPKKHVKMCQWRMKVNNLL